LTLSFDLESVRQIYWKRADLCRWDKVTLNTAECIMFRAERQEYEQHVT